MFNLFKILIFSLSLTVTAWADDHGHHGHHRHHGHHGHSHRYTSVPYVQREIVYLPAPVVQYVPVVPRYYAPPPPPPVHYYYNRPSAQGFVGSIVGGAVGYEIGRGDPLAAGIGAAAGAYIGNSRY